MKTSETKSNLDTTQITAPLEQSKLIEYMKNSERDLASSERKYLHKKINFMRGKVVKLTERNRELENNFLDIISRLSQIDEIKNDGAEGHSRRVSKYSLFIGEKMELSEEIMEQLSYAAPLHDVGNVSIPEDIRSKKGALTESEWEIMKMHTVIGARFFERTEFPIMKMAHDIALCHHERWDGRGYPNKLEKGKIPLEARIVGMAEVFDALTSQRPFKDAYPLEVAREIIEVDAGSHFDPEIAQTFVTHFDGICKIKKMLDPKESRQSEEFEWSERDRDWIELQESSSLASGENILFKTEGEIA
jgi:putative two-component system response regulator